MPLRGGQKINPICTECGHQGTSVVLRERLDPRNLRPERRLLCSRHVGWVQVTFGHSKPVAVFDQEQG